MIKVVRGNPTPEELAAALAVVQARAAATAAAAAAGGDGPESPEGWSDPARIARSVRPRPGPRSWARSYWPA
ncbi:acyl-CoA carboxylase epsilon subunit [Streptomyces sp. NPDC058579]|uniref:acyl-CoA carboxylase epsilon subunit n=1 Tax=Streptomyces sp. NPDC058579 TaxID=3346548 RepID=UPI003655DBAC